MVQTLIDEGHEVFLVTCHRSFPTCGFNAFGLRYMCDICNYREDLASSAVSGEYHSFRIGEIAIPDDYKLANEFVQSQASITKETVYDGFDVGESVLSSYISKTRDRDIELTENKPVLNALAVQTVVSYRAILRFMQEKKIEEVVLFNGRWDYYRAVFRAANKLGIHCLIYENLRSGGYLEYFDNAFPHIIKLRQNNFDAAWNECADTALRERVSREFFERKRGGEGINVRSFVDKQTKSLLPPGVEKHDKVLVLFNNSDDEVAAIGGNEYVNPFFNAQSDGIEYVVNLVGSELPDYLLIIRVHPNLEGLNFDYVKRIYELDGKYPNVVIVRPESPVDSYALLDIASKVIVFGSSIGIEANYWRKPVVLLAKSFYSEADLAHVPAGRDEIKSLLTADLPLKPRVNSEKIAFYLMRGGVKGKYYDFNTKNRTFLFKDVRLDHLPFLRKNYYRLLKRLRIKNQGALS